MTKPSRRLPRRAAAAALAVAAAASGWLLTSLGGDDGDADPAAATGGATATVTRQTLVDRETVEGTLGYAGARTVINRLGSAAGGEGAAPAANSLASYTPRGSAAATGSSATASSATASSATASSAIGSSATASSAIGSSATASQQTVPQETVPQETAPEETSPERTSPEQTSPEQTTPEQTAPDREQTEPEPTDRDRSAPEQAPRSTAPQSPGSGSGVAPQGGGGSGSGAAPPSGSGGGSGSADPVTLTSTARPGRVVGRGGVLYRVDGEPVVLMYGSTPAYRDLAPGDEGRDVLQLERNLAALGFEPGTVDSTFSSDTAAAVARWQEAHELPETGTVELGRVVFLRGERRIGERKATVGAPLAAGAEVMETTSTRRVVTIELDATKQSLARKGAGVEVTLPSQSTVRGRISSVGRVAREKESATGSAAPDGAAEDQELVIDVTVRLRSLRGTGRLDEAPVSVALASESARDVLAVPVTALAARRGGGYGLVLAGSGRIVPVEAGLFAGGYVEVSGRGIREGTRVAVPDA